VFSVPVDGVEQKPVLVVVAGRVVVYQLNFLQCIARKVIVAG